MLIAFLTGCTVFTYDSPTGEHAKLFRWGYDTKIGVMTASGGGPTTGPSLHIENLDSTAQAVQTANKALDLANTAAGLIK